MEPSVLEISSDEESPDYGWIEKMLREDDEDSDDVVIIKEVNNSKLNSKSKSSYSKQRDVDDDDDDDCVVLDGDPDKPLQLSDNDDNGDSDDLLIVGVKGQIACRDFPHPRHDCVEYPFKSTSHAKHCNMCHCYVCDSPAPCMYWGIGTSADDHCNATNKEEKWQICRKNLRWNNAAAASPSLVAGSESAVLPPSCHPMPQGNPQSTGHLRPQGIRSGPLCIRPQSNDLGNLFPHRILRQPYRVHNVVQRDKGQMNVGVANRFVSSKPSFKRVGTVGSSLTSSLVVSQCMKSVLSYVDPNGQIPNKRSNNYRESFTNNTGMQPCRSGISSGAVPCQPLTYSLFNNQLPNGQSMYINKSKNLDQHAVSSGFPDVSLSWESILRGCDVHCAQPITGSIHTQFTELSHQSAPVQGFNSDNSSCNDTVSAGGGFGTSLLVNTPQESLPAPDPNPVDAGVDTGLPFFDFELWDGIAQSEVNIYDNKRGLTFNY